MKSEDALASLGGAWDKIKTQAQGNWFIPQDAQLSPNRGPFVGITNYVMSTGPGRNLMSAVDMWNSLIGSKLSGEKAFSVISPPEEFVEMVPMFENFLKAGHAAHHASELLPSGSESK